MKLTDVLNEQGELMPRTRFDKAGKLANEFVDMAIKHYGQGDETYDAEVMAKKIAGEFAKQISVAIDENLKHRKMKKIIPNTGDYEGSFRATA